MKFGRQIFIVGGLAGIWCLLSGHYTGLLLSLGVLSCLISYFLYQKLVFNNEHKEFKFNLVKQVSYILWLVVQILKANMKVISAIINPRKIDPQLFNVKTSDLDELGCVIYANSITLTPGTISTNVREGEIQVHGLLPASIDGLNDNKMLERVRQLTSSS